MPMQSGDGTVYQDIPRPEPVPDPVMVTGDGIEITSPGIGAPAAGSAGPTDTGGSDEEETKAELYEKAKEADIEGRSSMSKKELAKALEDEA